MPEHPDHIATQRLDKLLVERELAPSRTLAQRLIANGQISVNGDTCRKPSATFSQNAHISILQGQVNTFVSIGGLKLLHALEQFNISPLNLRCLDLGASTGGFTDCLLQNGAAHIYSIDVGHDQLHPSLRNNPNVTAHEGLHLQNLTLQHLDNQPVDAIVTDISFISLQHAIPHLPQWLHRNGWAILLVKPQFEVGPSNIRKGGLANDPKLHLRILKQLHDVATQHALIPTNITHSPLIERQRNIEYLWLLKHATASPTPLPQASYEASIAQAFNLLKEA